jgi:hypothetical protein
LPLPRRDEIRARFAAGVARIRAAGWFDAMDACVAAAQSAPPETAAKQLNEIVLQYFHQGVACPFLEDESCSIHTARPLACREYLVSSPSAHCGAPSAGSVEKIEMVLKPSRALRTISRSGRFSQRFLPLILALELAEEGSHGLVEKPGAEWMSSFLQEALRK